MVKQLLSTQQKDVASARGSKKVQRIKPSMDERQKREYRAQRFESKNRYGVLRC